MIHEINSVPVASQKSCVVEINTLSTEDSGRDLAGTMHNTFLPIKYKLIVKWPAQTLADRATIVAAIVSAANPSAISIKFDDPAAGTTSTKTFMMGTPMTQELVLGNEAYWNEMEIHFIEN